MIFRKINFMQHCKAINIFFLSANGDLMEQLA